MIRTAPFAHLLACAALLLSPLATAETVRGSGKSASEAREVAGIQSLSLAVPGRLEISQGDAEKLTITADDNVLPLIETTVERGDLRIRFKERNVTLRTSAKIRITLQVRTLEGISVAGSGEILAPALNTKGMKVSISGSGDVTLGGKAPNIDVHIAGSGDVKAGKFETQTAKVDIAGSGDTTVWARESLRVSIAGSGDVRYYGDPALKSSIAGSGHVRKAGNQPG